MEDMVYREGTVTVWKIRVLSLGEIRKGIGKWHTTVAQLEDRVHAKSIWETQTISHGFVHIGIHLANH